MYVTFLIVITSKVITQIVNILLEPISSKKRQLNKCALVSHCRDLTFYHRIYTLSKLLELQFHWKVQNRTTGRKRNVSLADLIRCCPFSQSRHSGVFRFLVVFILQFVKIGTPTPLSPSNVR